ncbi:MAG: 3-oxoacyl-[acyl-carrier-protein] reductase [Rhodospirillales bacterium]|nr:3-oxoacyl-[acyl-carrier-protein] reductase [Rhodospirillales bacterium]
MFDLAGRTALVTGASGGIGGAIARTLYSQGANIVVSGTRREALEALAAELGPNAFVAAADLDRAEAAGELVAAAEARFGRLDILVHNAGITRDNLMLRMSDDEWQRVIDINLTVGFRLVRAALRGMMKRRWGRLIGISSVVGETGNGGQANYAASKAGMVAMFKSIAKEVASRGITANCVAPGYIETAMTESFSDDFKKAILTGIPVARAGTSDEVAACVAFLASNEAAYVTGQTLHVNGGMAMP